MTTENINDHQKEFDENYIGINNIAKEMGLTTNAVVAAKNRGLLTNPILVHGRGKPVYLWKRSHLKPILEQWKTTHAGIRNLKKITKTTK